MGALERLAALIAMPDNEVAGLAAVALSCITVDGTVVFIEGEMMCVCVKG